MEKYIKMMEKWFAQLPPLPVNVKGILVKVAPWFALIFGILGVFGAVAATGLVTTLAPAMMLGGGLGAVTGGLMGTVLMLVSSVLMLMAFPGLRDRKMAGWTWSFYSEVVGVVSSVVALNLVGAAVSALIGFYVLFQIKSYYK